MPTYRYRCGECGEEFERWQSIRDDALQVHDHGCGGQLVKVMTPAGIVLKGSGFYKTDSRSASSGRGRRDGATEGGKDGDKDGERGRDRGGEKTGDRGDRSTATEPTPSKGAEPSAPAPGGPSSTGAAAS
jgi:putative FmdB family regulatory protein